MNVSQKDSAVHSKIHLIVAFHKYSDLEMPADTEQAQQIFERTSNGFKYNSLMIACSLRCKQEWKDYGTLLCI